MWFRIVTYNAGSHNLSFNVFDISVNINNKKVATTTEHSITKIRLRRWKPTLAEDCAGCVLWLVSSLLLEKADLEINVRHLRHLLPVDNLEFCCFVGINLLFLCHILFAAAVLNGALYAKSYAGKSTTLQWEGKGTEWEGQKHKFISCASATGNR